MGLREKIGRALAKRLDPEKSEDSPEITEEKKRADLIEKYEKDEKERLKRSRRIDAETRRIDKEIEGIERRQRERRAERAGIRSRTRAHDSTAVKVARGIASFGTAMDDYYSEIEKHKKRTTKKRSHSRSLSEEPFDPFGFSMLSFGMSPSSNNRRNSSFNDSDPFGFNFGAMNMLGFAPPTKRRKQQTIDFGFGTNDPFGFSQITGFGFSKSRRRSSSDFGFNTGILTL
jgi:hypothetical protein